MLQIAIYMCGALSLISAICVILSKNPVHSILSLILTFFTTAAIWLFLEAEFLSVLLILVYVGAVMVLFMFVVMMLDIDIKSLRTKFSTWMSAAVCIPVLLSIVLVDTFVDEKISSASAISLSYGLGYSNIKMLGHLLFSEYLLQFEIAGVLLLAAIIAAIVLVQRGPRDRRWQKVSQQISASPSQRIRLVEDMTDD